MTYSQIQNLEPFHLLEKTRKESCVDIPIPLAPKHLDILQTVFVERSPASIPQTLPPIREARDISFDPLDIPPRQQREHNLKMRLNAFQIGQDAGIYSWKVLVEALREI